MKYAYNENWISRISESKKETKKQKEFKEQFISNNYEVSDMDKEFV